MYERPRAGFPSLPDPSSFVNRQNFCNYSITNFTGSSDEPFHVNHIDYNSHFRRLGDVRHLSPTRMYFDIKGCRGGDVPVPDFSGSSIKIAPGDIFEQTPIVGRNV